MYKTIIILFFLFPCIECFSQVKYEKGYFIDDKDQKTECLIKNYDWASNPAEIEYKLTENEKSNDIRMTSIKEFGIYNFSKYIKCRVKIDRSGKSEGKNDSPGKHPNWSEEVLMLKVLIEGEASLYVFGDGDVRRYFYKVRDSSIEQLEYNKYFLARNLVTDDNYK